MTEQSTLEPYEAPEFFEVGEFHEETGFFYGFNFEFLVPLSFA